MTKEAWYKSWFDSHYYHLLYDHRDEREAQEFITRLTESLSLPTGERFWTWHVAKEDTHWCSSVRIRCSRSRPV